MLKDLRRRVCWVVITLAGFSQPGPMGSGTVILIVAALLNPAARAIWLSLPQPWRDRYRHEAPYRRARVRRDVRTVALTWIGQDSTSRTNPPNSQEHHHAYP